MLIATNGNSDLNYLSLVYHSMFNYERIFFLSFSILGLYLLDIFKYLI